MSFPRVNVGLDHNSNAYQGVQGYDAMGGTYYGDEQPPECTQNCEPIEMTSSKPGLGDRITGILTTLFRRPYAAATLANGVDTALRRSPKSGSALAWQLLATATQGRQFQPRTRKLGPERQKTGPRKYAYVPNPHSTKTSEIIENCLTGLRQTHLDLLPEFWPMVHDGLTAVSAVRPVSALTYGRNYYHLTFKDASARPYAVATVDDVGWLLSAAVLRDDPGLPDDEEITSLLASHGKRRVHGLRWIQVLSTEVGTTSSLMPLAEAKADDGSTMYVNHRRQLFVGDGEGEVAIKTAAGTLRLRRLSR